MTVPDANPVALADFVPPRQYGVLKQFGRNDGALPWGRAVIPEAVLNQARGLAETLAERLENMPVLYEQDGLADAAVAYLRYVMPDADMAWYITERAPNGDPAQCFGLAGVHSGHPEMSYIDVRDLIRCGAELDVHWTPRTLAEIKAEAEPGPLPDSPSP